MNNTAVYEFEESRADLFEVANRNSLWKNLVFFNCCAQISSIAIFLSNVVVVASLQYVNKSHNVLALQLPHDPYFADECILHILILVD